MINGVLLNVIIHLIRPYSHVYLMLTNHTHHPLLRHSTLHQEDDVERRVLLEEEAKMKRLALSEAHASTLEVLDSSTSPL